MDIRKLIAVDSCQVGRYEAYEVTLKPLNQSFMLDNIEEVISFQRHVKELLAMGHSVYGALHFASVYALKD